MNETKGAQARQTTFGAALAGGLIGALLAVALLLFAAPSLISSRIVRQGLLADPKILPDAVEALRDAQYAPVLATNRAAIETPFASSWKGAAKPEVTLVEFFDYACPYCKASNPAVDRLLEQDKGLRVVYRELPILGPDSVTAARLSLEASSSGASRDSTTACGRRAVPHRKRSRRRPAPPASRPSPSPTQRSRASSIGT